MHCARTLFGLEPTSTNGVEKFDPTPTREPDHAGKEYRFFGFFGATHGSAEMSGLERSTEWRVTKTASEASIPYQPRVYAFGPQADRALHHVRN
jgi:hypothetical protein